MKTKEEILNKLEELILDSFNYEELDAITPEMGIFTDLDLDSLDAVDFSVALYGAFEVKLTPADFVSIKTVGDLTEFLFSKNAK